VVEDFALPLGGQEIPLLQALLDQRPELFRIPETRPSRLVSVGSISGRRYQRNSVARNRSSRSSGASSWYSRSFRLEDRSRAFGFAAN